MVRLIFGFRFHPTEEELIHILNHMITQQLSSYEHIVTKNDLYGIKEPWEIFGDTEENCRYFLTELKKTTETGNRVARTIGNGTWKGQDKGQPVLNRQKSVIGYKKSLRYENRKSLEHGRWLMKEFSLGDELSTGSNQYVLCRIKRKCNLKENSILSNKQQLNESENTKKEQKRPRMEGGPEHMENWCISNNAKPVENLPHIVPAPLLPFTTIEGEQCVTFDDKLETHGQDGTILNGSNQLMEFENTNTTPKMPLVEGSEHLVNNNALAPEKFSNVFRGDETTMYDEDILSLGRNMFFEVDSWLNYEY